MKVSERILIVDRNLVVCEQAEPILGEAGLRVGYCSDIESACEQIRLKRPRLILLDAQLLRSNHGACRKLRQCAPELRLPIILIVPPAFPDISDLFCGCDADDFLCFPFKDDELLLRVLMRSANRGQQKVEQMAQVDYHFLADISNLANTDMDTNQVLQQVVAAIGQVIAVHRCSITMIREDEQCGYVMASNDDPELNGLRIELDKYPEIRETIRTSKPILIDNIYRHPLMEGVRPYIERLGFNSLLVLPMVDRQRVIGVLVVRTRRSIDGFTAEEISFCQLVTNVATSALRYARLGRQTPSAGEDSLIDRRVFEERGALLDMAAHDLRVLVSVVDGYCLLLQETKMSNLSTHQVELVDGLMTGCRRLVEMTNNLLDFSRIESGHLELEVANVDLCQLIESALRDMQPLMSRREIRLALNSRPEKIIARFDADNIRRVFYNLMSNAIKFTPQGGTIELSLESDETEAYVSVTDTGPGISSKQLARLFEKFNRGQSPDGATGNGLGLSICKRIVDAHQGRIWAESNVGQGSRFTFSLPRTH